MSAKRDGGSWALAGYLYQIVGVLGIAAHAYSADAPSDDHIDVQLGLTDVNQSLTRIEHEQLGQDALLTYHSLGLTKGDHSVAVQFKFSANPSENKIDEPELGKILKSFSDSVEQARNELLDFTACVLITNRPFTSQGGGAQKLWNDSVQAQGDMLRLVKDYPLEKSNAFLQHFAHEYGATDEEIQIGINVLIGTIVRQPQMAVSMRDLVKAFAGYPDVKKITAETLLPQSTEALHRFDAVLGLSNHLVRREVLVELAQLCSENALIVLHGGGGCGKTIALYQWLLDAQVVSMFTPMQHVVSNWVTEGVCDWAGIPTNDRNRRHDNTETTIGRLLIANPEGSLPILYLGLDELDDASLDSQFLHSLRTVVKWFWNEDNRIKLGKDNSLPRAVLIITCRDMDEVTQKWLDPDISGYGEISLPASLKVDVFTPKELDDAIRSSGLDSSIADRLKATSALIARYSDRFVPFPQLPSTSLVANPSIIDSLKHPVIWHAFLELDPVSQASVLDSGEGGLNKLAQRFINRFCRKAVSRGKLGGIQEMDLLDMLHLVALHCDERPNIQYEFTKDWAEPSSGFSPEPRKIYKESLSHGIIVADGINKWHWSYEWIRTYLAMCV